MRGPGPAEGLTVTPLLNDGHMSAHTTNAILAVAARSHGVCTRRDLLVSGIGGGAIDRRLNDGTLQIVRRGVYEAPVLVEDSTPRFRAVLAVPNSALSRSTAAVDHRFHVPRTASVHVTALNGTSRTIPGVVVHETRELDPIDVERTPDGLPITSPARTLFDLASEVGRRRLHHLVATQTSIGSPPIERLQECFVRLARKGRPGTNRLRSILDDLDPGSLPFGESELERRVWDCLRRHGIHGLSPQYKPPWFDGTRGIVDFAHHDAALIVEADGRRWHARRQAMAEDRRRDRQAAANGWLVIRLMWEDVVHREEPTFSELAAIVDTRCAGRAA